MACKYIDSFVFYIFFPYFSSINVEKFVTFEIDSILDFIKNEDLRSKILNTKITTYEEI